MYKENKCLIYFFFLGVGVVLLGMKEDDLCKFFGIKLMIDFLINKLIVFVSRRVFIYGMFLLVCIWLCRIVYGKEFRIYEI